MFRKAILGLVAVMGLVMLTSDTASANWRGRYYGGGYRYGYRPVVRPVVRPIVRPRFVNPPIYTAPVYGYPAGGYYNAPGFGFYVR